MEALQTFFANVPNDLGLAYVVVVHLSPDHESELPAILQRQTKMAVTQVGDHDLKKLEPNRVYVIAPDRKLEITDTAVGASKFDEPRGKRAAIDLFFRSLARSHGDGFAVVLSGSGTDGAVGAKAVKEAGGLVLVQDPHEAAHDSMPRAVIATGVADVVLPVRELAARLSELARSKPFDRRQDGAVRWNTLTGSPDEAAFRSVLEFLKNRTGHDFSRYKRNTVVRRLARRMQLSHQETVADYLRYVSENNDEVQQLFDDLLISVTTFFRDPEAWSALQARVIAPLVERAGAAEQIRVWVPGCATGEEAYTLAILFNEEFQRRRVRGDLVIFASDVDESALTTGREGLFPNAIAADVSDARLARFFTIEDDHYRVTRELRDPIVFAAHSLLRDPPFSKLDLASCRNLLIYLDRDLQEQVLTIFRYACRDDGFLFLGASETVDSELFSPIDKKYRIFEAQKAADGARPPLPDLLATPHGRELRQVLDSRSRVRQPAGDAHIDALEDAAPPSVLLDDRWNVLHVSPFAARFFEQGAGPLARNVTDLVRTELRDELHAVLHRASESSEPQLSAFLPVRFDGSERRVGMLVQRRPQKVGTRMQMLVTFLDAGAGGGHREAQAEESTTDLVASLREKLRQAERRADRTRDEHHLANEDLRAANEELQSLNEEYRSTTEELETSKEELQSINEELQTVNHELKGKLDEVSQARNDIENLMTATDVAILFLDEELCIKRFTPRLSEFFSIKARDQDRPIGDVTHSLDYTNLEEDARRVLRSGSPLERAATSRDGRSFIVLLNPYRVSGTERTGGVVVTFVDVTSLKAAEAAVRESERKLASELEVMRRLHHMTMVAAATPTLEDALGEILDTAIELHGADFGNIQLFYPKQEHLRIATQRGFGPAFLKLFETVDSSDNSACGRAMRERRPCRIDDVQSEPSYAAYRGIAAEAGYRSVQSVPLIDRSGHLVGVLSTHFRDVHTFSARDEQLGDLLARQTADLIASRSEQEKVTRLNEELSQRSEDLAAQARNKEDFLAVLGHELRNPLAAIVNSLALASAEDAMTQRRLDVLRRQSEHLVRLVNDLLDITRINHGKLRLDRKIVDVTEYVREAAEAISPSLQSKNLELAFDVPSLPVYADADPARLAQILDNLLRNAVAYTEKGRVAISVRKERAFVRIAITDTGIGIGAAEAASIFEAFSQTDRGKLAGGLGLGLTLVRRLVELHGGAVGMTSDGQDAGSEFYFTIPIATSSPRSAQAATTRTLPRRRILVVDDQPDTADMFGELLEMLEQEVYVAYSAGAAIELANEHRPEVAFLDLSMPDTGGRELARQLRQDFGPDELTLIALTGFGRDHPDLRDSVFSHHLLKPAMIETVVELLHSLPPRPER